VEYITIIDYAVGILAVAALIWAAIYTRAEYNSNRRLTEQHRSEARKPEAK
jgi:hypothetical protein